jgi:phosphopantetheinyl transferase
VSVTRQIEAGRGPDVLVAVLRVPREAQPADLRLLAPDERARADRFRFETDRASYVTTRAALRRCLGAAIGVFPADVELVLGAHQRPALHPRHGATLDFNVSHSGDHAAIALSPTGRVGVDIETHGRVHDLRALIPTVMADGERGWIDAAESDTAFGNAFYACWTRKEAVLKAIGTGLIDDLTTLDVPTQPLDGAVSCAGTTVPLFQLTTRRIGEACTLSVALVGRGTIQVAPVVDAGRETWPVRIPLEPTAHVLVPMGDA